MSQIQVSNKGIEIALCREASMSAMAIGTGLTHIRKYDFYSTGYFYSGLQAFTSGIERVLKIILIYEYRLANGDKFPDNSTLKTFGHKLDDLIRKAQEINKWRHLNVQDSHLDQDPLYPKIISLLTDFAMQARYYNLDYITGKQQPNLEPLVRWDNDICQDILNRHYKPRARSFDPLCNEADKLESYFMVNYTSESGFPISNLKSFLEEAKTVLTKQRYSMYYLYTIARTLCGICIEMEYQGNLYPNLREYFPLFNVNDRKLILRRTKWDPLLP